MRRLAFVLVLLVTISSCNKEEEVLGLPVLTTKVVTNITDSTANSGGVISDDGNLEITAKGVCWSTTVQPTIVNDHTSDGISITQFDSNLIDLIPERPR